ncbi:MAG: hypothetical protein MAG795_00673 [Candidatus Woesearchaeota archaeon]|nr:hypothetical protein [Candidatus Woesearchaeota archaeon]
MSKRAQAAMEFLMTYGWAIMVVLIVIGALAYFGVLNPQRLLPPKCTFPTGISCNDHLVVSGGLIKLNLINGLGEAIYVMNVSAIPMTGNPINDNCSTDYTGPGDVLYMRNGDELDIVLDQTCIISSTFADPNSKYRWDILFEYYYADSGIGYNKTISGELLTSIQE